MLDFKQVVNSLLQLGYLLAEEAGADVLQDLMTNEQAVKFFGTKP
jgi:hypothetical protein